ncbi:MAG: aminoacyl-tRNA hydrolase [Phycisphaeraceae bacterium]|nr:aminoacyl-tRNA hydrolase [Phycisphaeraceae bacterium]
MKLIVGLGNPGREYEKTRHNAGFMVVDRLAARHALGHARSRFHAGVIDGRIGDHPCLLMQPLTFMNRSGLAVGEAMRFYKLDIEDLLVVVDDVALPVGRIRLRASGSAGGHNGLSDIERALGGRDYARLRIGIDAPPGMASQHDYVLGRFNAEQVEALAPALDRACDCIEAWLRDPISDVMCRFNSAD